MRGDTEEDATAWYRSIADSIGTSRMRIRGGGYSESEVPFLRPIMGQELSSVQYRPLDEQLFKAMAVLFDQKQRHAVARLVGTGAPVKIRTPDVNTTPANESMVQKLLQATYEKLPFALPSDQANLLIKDREQKLLTGCIDIESEPVTTKRRIAPPASPVANPPAAIAAPTPQVATPAAPAKPPLSRLETLFDELKRPTRQVPTTPSEVKPPPPEVTTAPVSTKRPIPKPATKPVRVKRRIT